MYYHYLIPVVIIDEHCLCIIVSGICIDEANSAALRELYMLLKQTFGYTSDDSYRVKCTVGHVVGCDSVLQRGWVVCVWVGHVACACVFEG